MSDSSEHLSGLSTPWVLLRQARDLLPAVQQAARAALLDRYGPLIRRYLGGAFRGRADQQEAIDECLQRFGVRLCEGAFDGATPQRGRFRDYLKQSCATWSSITSASTPQLRWPSCPTCR
jgi:hypothetical protein